MAKRKRTNNDLQNINIKLKLNLLHQSIYSHYMSVGGVGNQNEICSRIVFQKNVVRYSSTCMENSLVQI
jgi:hypothetical protein